MIHRKKTREDKAEWRALIDARYGGAVAAEVRSLYTASRVGYDDLHDAFAALWTA
jgi:hypothetical protein